MDLYPVLLCRNRKSYEVFHGPRLGLEWYLLMEGQLAAGLDKDASGLVAEVFSCSAIVSQGHVGAYSICPISLGHLSIHR